MFKKFFEWLIDKDRQLFETLFVPGEISPVDTLGENSNCEIILVDSSLTLKAFKYNGHNRDLIMSLCDYDRYEPRYIMDDPDHVVLLIKGRIDGSVTVVSPGDFVIVKNSGELEVVSETTLNNSYIILK